MAKTYTLGVDISSYQTVKSWASAVAQGVRFAFIRNADGLTFGDPKFAEHWAGARGKVLRAPYHYFRVSSGMAQAQFFLSRIDRNDLGELPPVIDVEIDATDDQYHAVQIKAWVDAVQAVYHKPPIIYTRPDIWQKVKPWCPWASAHDLWIARYPFGGKIISDAIVENANVDPPDVAPFGRFTFWQFGSTGAIDGISFPCDVNVFDGDEAALRAYAGISSETVPPVPAVAYTWQDFINATKAASVALRYPEAQWWSWLMVRAGIDSAALAKRKQPYDGPAIGDLNWSAKEIAAYRAAGGKGRVQSTQSAQAEV